MSKAPTRQSLTGKYIYLRAATPDDAANFHFWLEQSEPQSLTSRPKPFLTISEAVEQFKQSEKSAEYQTFAIVRIDDNSPIGMISFFNYNYINRSTELDILIDPEMRKKGYAKEAITVLINYLFKFRNLNKVFTDTASYNKASVKLLESLGFQKDGILRDHYFYDDSYYNKLIYSMLRIEWQ